MNPNEESPEERNDRIRPRICVFCSTQNGHSPSGPQIARRLAQIMHDHGLELVYGGGTTGLMGELAKERVRLGRPEDALGVIPYALVQTERQGRGAADLANYLGNGTNQKRPKTASSSPSHSSLTTRLKNMLSKSSSTTTPDWAQNELNSNLSSRYGKDLVELPVDKTFGRVVGAPGLHKRKELMIDLVMSGGSGSGFIALPGGFGSLDEVMEVLMTRQLGHHRKVMVLVNVDGFWDGLGMWMDNAVEKGFLRADTRALVRIVSDVDEAVEFLTHIEP